jgi:hypothetical protein
MPKLPVKIKPGALPTTTDEVTQGVLDKLPEVDRRELMRGALGSLGDLSLAGKAVDVVAPAVKATSKMPDLFEIPVMKKYMKKSYLDEYGAENQSIHFGFVEELLGFENKEVFDSLKRWVEEGIISSKEFDSLVKKHNLTPENAYDKFKQMDESEHLMLGIDEDVIGTYPKEFQESFKATNEREFQNFLSGAKQFEELDTEIQEALKYLINDKKMGLSEIKNELKNQRYLNFMDD